VTAPTLTTARLLLRPWRDSDLAPFAALNADPRVMEHFPAVLSRAESDAFAERIRRQFDEYGYGLWAVEVPGEAEFIGFTGLWRPSFEAPFMPCVELGWRLAHAYWGRGYGVEGGRACLDCAFNTLGLKEVLSLTAVVNTRSRRVIEKLAFTRDPAEDFDHPKLPEGHRLKRHVLYRLARPGV
jgi:RimJ/RimL family protein N-acetyltransferase